MKVERWDSVNGTIETGQAKCPPHHSLHTQSLAPKRKPVKRLEFGVYDDRRKAINHAWCGMYQIGKCRNV